MTGHRARCVVCALAFAACLGGLAAPATVARAQETDSGADAGPAAGTVAPVPQPAFDPLAERIAYLHGRLRITPAQEPLWNGLAQVMRENATALAPLLKARFQAMQRGNATDILDADEKLDEAQLDGLRKFAAAFQALYAGLSDEQKKIADFIFRRSQFSRGPAAPLPNTYYPLSPAYPTFAAVPASPEYPPGYDFPADSALFVGPFIGVGTPFFFHGQPGFRPLRPPTRASGAPGQGGATQAPLRPR